ncbi:MAG: GNAT family N-acetyltransferase [Defluviitaleaceae bacterium]|nr:GNAT family N-acetyltransferase [Defluviitaleaceae bacterium]MCL2238391.1 GNAT family N-acetyltransferase [Defluviitaleaceae bacterium]
MIIEPMTDTHLSEYADVVRRSFATVADEFGYADSPEFSSNIPDELLADKIAPGYYPFGACVDGKIVGFVSLTHAGEGVYKLQKLTILPEYRHHGYGKALLDFCKAKAQELGGNKISIKLMDNDTRLKKWYLSHGFVHTSTKHYEGIPFPVGHMEWLDEQ